MQYLKTIIRDIIYLKPKNSFIFSVTINIHNCKFCSTYCNTIIICNSLTYLTDIYTLICQIRTYKITFPQKYRFVSIFL